MIFEGEEEHRPKDQQDFLALVEFKRFYIDAGRDPPPGRVSDRDKLLMMLAYLDTCPWGIVCGWANENHIQWQKATSIKPTHDRWYEKRIELPEGYTTPLFFCARLNAPPTTDASKNCLQPCPLP